MRRSMIVTVVVVITAAVAWVTWPRPDLYIRVRRGGVAQVIRLFGTRPLPDTLYIQASGPVTVRVENQDTVTHRLGMFGVAGQHTNDFTISQPGVYSGYCTAHPGRRLTYVVR